MPSPLSELPVEVIETIISWLDRTDLCSVRLTCKELQRKTLHQFFAVIQTDLSANSLQKLHSISQTEHLKHHVQTLLIRGRYHIRCRVGEGLHWHRLEEWGSPSHAVTHFSPGVQLLRGILTKMVNCKSFQFESCDGLGRLDEPHNFLASDAIAIFLRIIAETGLPVKSFEINIVSLGTPRVPYVIPRQPVDAKRLEKHLYQQPGFIVAWENLENLRLALELTSDTLDWARDLVLHTTRLKQLSLHFTYDHSPWSINSLLSLPKIIQGLQEFSLECIRLTAEMLSTLLLHCRSNLHRLSLSHVYIDSGNWVQPLTALKSFPLLEDIAVDWPKWRRDNGIIHLHFPALDENPMVPGSSGREFELKCSKLKGKVKKKVWGARFQGRVGMDKALEVLAESMVHTQR